MRLAAIFSDNMVLQREVPIPVWGTARAGEAVTVTLAGQTAKTVAGVDGHWELRLPALPVGGPYEMIVSGDETLTLHNVLLGEVWICSGQSNMEWPTELSNNGEAEVAAANYPNMRLFTVPKHAAYTPEDDIPNASGWAVCTPASIPLFSAVGYFFGRMLHQELQVPVGLINASWGGTVAETWTSRQALLAEPSLVEMVENYDRAILNIDKLIEDYRQAKVKWANGTVPEDPGNSGWERGWADPATDISEWEQILLPGGWQLRGHNYSGVFWFRKEVDVPANWAGKELVLSIGACDKSDVTYFNNVQVGGVSIEERSDSWCMPRVYTIPAELVKVGKNVIAVRVFSNIYQGGMIGPSSLMHLTVAGDANEAAMVLKGEWAYQVEHNFGIVATPFGGPAAPPGQDNPNWPTLLYNGMIAPVIPYALRGAIWYQGESNVGRSVEYQTLFPVMISDWRQRFGVGDFPFLFVQLANYMEEPTEPADCPWAELREAQTMTLGLNNTGMAVIIDIGEAADIHPRNKQDVSKRLALNALANTYGRTELPYSGPMYDHLEVEGNTIRLFFTHLNGGLRCASDKLTGFAIAGEDRTFVWADAHLDGDTVVVSSPQVPHPVAVRYGWDNNPLCNLYNQAELPASPFRTDKWVAGIPAAV